MAKNQKRGTVELRWQRLGTVMLLVAGIAMLTVGYVMQRRAHDELGQQIKAVEREIGWITDRVQREQEQLERCRRKDVLLWRAGQMGLGLTDIVSSQRLTIPLLDAAAGTSPVAGRSPVPSVVWATAGPLAAAGTVPLSAPR